MSIVIITIAGWFAFSIVAALLMGRAMAIARRSDPSERAPSHAMPPHRLILANRRAPAPRPEKACA
jgi:hypothetical protein